MMRGSRESYEVFRKRLERRLLGPRSRLSRHEKAEQAWEIGSHVKVGFLTLMITGITTPNSGQRWYVLSDGKGRSYTFTPYLGLERT